MDKFIVRTRVKSSNLDDQLISEPSTSTLNAEDTAPNKRSRERSTSSSSSEHSVESGSCPPQPRPPTKKENVTRPRSVREEWLKQFDWLESKEERSFCKYCCCSLVGGLTHLNRHAMTSLHKKNASSVKKTVSVSQFLTTANEAKTFNRRLKEGELKLSMFIAEHNLPMLIMDHLTKLLPSVLPDSELAKKINCGRTKTTKILDTLKEECQHDLKTLLGSKKFSLMIDETTDISVQKCLAILTRHVNMERHKICDSLIALKEVTDCTANGIVEVILSVLHELDIPTKNLIGFAADNASVMMGDQNGVQARLKQMNPNVFVMGCICHSLHLCASAAANKLPREVEDLTRDIYNYLSTSPKRLQAYKEFQDFVNIKPHKILRPSQTRWLSLEAVVSRILEQWPALRLYFISAVDTDNLAAADKILDALNNIQFKLYFTFLSYILPLVNQLNLEFQSEKTQLHRIYPRINMLYKTILTNFMKKSHIDSKNSVLDINPINPREYLPEKDLYLGIKTEQLLSGNTLTLRNPDITSFKTNCLNYYVELCVQIRKRFQNIAKYKNFELLDPTKALFDSPSIAPLIGQFNFFCPEEDIEQISSEFRMISNLDKAVKEEMRQLDCEKFWFHLYDMKNSDNERIFKHICDFVFDLMVLAPSNAASERIFSQLALIKTKTRNRLIPETCNSLLLAKGLLKSHSNDKCYLWEPSKRLIAKNIQY